jgi:hypothetical protein
LKAFTTLEIFGRKVALAGWEQIGILGTHKFARVMIVREKLIITRENLTYKRKPTACRH